MSLQAPSHARVLIAGSGMAGLSAGLWCARLGLEPVVIEGAPAGGVMTTAATVEDFPGWSDGGDGPALAERMRAQASAAGARFVAGALERLERIEHLEPGPRTARLDDGAAIRADSVIVALGGRYLTTGVPGEAELLGYGVSHCATCDGFFCHGRPAVVIGGGDTAIGDALHLTEHASSVTVVHRGAAPAAQSVLVSRARAHAKIHWRPHGTLAAIRGTRGPGGVEAVTIFDEASGATSDLACAGVWVAIGRGPATAPVREAVALDDDGYVRRPDGWSTATSAPGVFAAGECTDRTYRQAITAAAMGCMAAHDARRWLETRGTHVERS
jgi:thioredoxin reductase (NADPH)